MRARSILFLGLLSLFFTLSSALPAREFFDFDEPEQVVMDQFNEYEEFVAGQDYEFKEHAYDHLNGIYRFRHSKTVAKRTVVNLDKLNVKRLRCNAKRSQISLALPAGSDVGEKLDGKVIFFQPTLNSGCGHSRNYYFVESVETDSSSDDEVLVKARISEQNPRELLESVDATFYQENIRDEVARVVSYEEDDAELSSSDLQEQAPEEVRQRIREIQESELHHVKRYRKRFFGRLWKGLQWVGSKIMDVQQKIAAKFDSVKTFLSEEHTKKFPSDKNGARVFENTFPITFSRTWKITESPLLELKAQADASFTIDFCFSFKVQTMILKTLSFTLGARAEFTGGLTVTGTLEKIKNFKSLTAGATFRIPTVVAPGLTILLNPYVRLEGQAKVKVTAEINFVRTIVMPRWTKTWTYGETGDSKINGASPQQNNFQIAALREDKPYTATAVANGDLFITPILGLQVGVSALELFELLAGPIVKVPLQFSVMGTVASAYETAKLPSCALALHFSLGVQAGITIEFKVLGISAIKKEWVYTFTKDDTKKTTETDIPKMTIVRPKQEPAAGSKLAIKLEALRADKLTAENNLQVQKALREAFPETESKVDLTLTDEQKAAFLTARGRAAPAKLAYKKWKQLTTEAEAKVTQYENEIFALQAQIDEITIPNLLKLRDDFVRRAHNVEPSAVPTDLKANFLALTGTNFDDRSLTSEGQRYRLINTKLKEMLIKQKEDEEKSLDGIKKKLVFFSFCLYEVVADGAPAGTPLKQKHKFAVPSFFSLTTKPKIDDTFPKIEKGSSNRYKNNQEILEAFVKAESRGQAAEEEGVEEDKAEKLGWRIVPQPL